MIIRKNWLFDQSNWYNFNRIKPEKVTLNFLMYNWSFWKSTSVNKRVEKLSRPKHLVWVSFSIRPSIPISKCWISNQLYFEASYYNFLISNVSNNSPKMSFMPNFWSLLIFCTLSDLMLNLVGFYSISCLSPNIKNKNVRISLLRAFILHNKNPLEYLQSTKIKIYWKIWKVHGPLYW